MKILIIGGSRFVGPLLVDKLLAAKHDVTIFNRGLVNASYPDGVTFIKGDRDKGFEITEHFDTVIDMCAYNGKQAQKALDELSYDFFLHFGSVASYKQSEIFPITEDSPIGDLPLMGDYGKGKAECEKVLKSSGKKYATIRPTYILGANNYIDREHFIYTQINEGKTIIIPGNGQALTSYIFADDVANILKLLAEKQIEGAFTCAGDELITLKGLTEFMASLLGKKATITFNPDADGENTIDEEFPFGNENLVYDNHKIKDLGITLTPLLEGLTADFNSYYKDLL